jgi:hypothetical protein
VVVAPSFISFSSCYVSILASSGSRALETERLHLESDKISYEPNRIGASDFLRRSSIVAPRRSAEEQ